jgi:hypothetical protein
MEDRIHGAMVEEPVQERRVTDDWIREEQPMTEEQPMAKEYRPSKQELLREYQIGIRFLSVGCVVSVGCKEIPFRSVKEAMEEVNKYVNQPYEEGKRWRQLFDSAE